MANLSLTTFHVKNFKAIRNSRKLRFTPLTIFIGNNGSGKSSVIEGLETYQDIVLNGLDHAMNRWRGFEHIRNNAVSHDPKEISTLSEDRIVELNPIEFSIEGNSGIGPFRVSMAITQSPGGNELFILDEKVVSRDKQIIARASSGEIYLGQEKIGDMTAYGSPGYSVPDGSSVIGSFRDNKDVLEILRYIASWQFVMLDPWAMGSPRPQKRTRGAVRLDRSGANIADYLLDIRRQDQSAFDGIVETLQYVLPYARDFQTELTSELERNVYLQLTESTFKIPGWLLSSGTLRIVSLLALLRHPSPPPVIVIEEIENGLDPRTIHLLADEIRTVVESGRSQIIATTHSPYLLDLLNLSQIVVVERSPKGEPTFFRPSSKASLKKWAESFGPGRLYTMSRLGRNA